MEYDNLLYADLDELLPIFESCYPGLGVTFDADSRAIPGFMYVPHHQAMFNFIEFVTAMAPKGYYDMHILSKYRHSATTDQIDFLPIIHTAYTKDFSLINKLGHKVRFPKNYSKNIEIFNSIFDAAAIGQYLGGTDSNYLFLKPGFINKTCIFNPSKLSYIWEMDSYGRLIPFAIYRQEKRRINSLHIHCKKLDQFMSLTPKEK